MRKFCAVVLFILIAFTLFGCAQDNLVGSWTAEASVVGLDEAEKSYAQLILNEDGTGEHNMYSGDDILSSDEFTYVAEGNTLKIVAMSGKEVTCEYILEGDTLKIVYNNRTVEYSK